MNGTRYLIDTNVAIYLLAGDQKIGELLDGNQIFISFISELELLSFRKLTAREISILKEFLDDVIIIDINKKIKDLTIGIRRSYELKLPDAIIAATAKFLDMPLMTADQQFKNIEDPQILLYHTQ